MSLKIFQESYLEEAIEKEEWIQYLPKTDVSNDGVIEVYVPGRTQNYMDLKKSNLSITFQVFEENGSNMI